MSDPLLVATDGGRTAASALRFAAAFASAHQVDVEVVSVVAPLSDLPMALPHRDELEHAHALGVADQVREHVRGIVGPVAWPIHVRLGRPAPAICDTTRARSARMVVLGVEGKKTEGNPTAVELLHLAETPVLLVRDGRLPKVALAGIDFRPSSLAAVQAALELVGGGGELHLVHVRPALDFPAANLWDWTTCYEGAVENAFAGLAERLARETDAKVYTHTRSGDPATALMAAASDLGAEVMAIGSDGYICNGRVVVGRVARRLMEDAPLDVLATPVSTVIPSHGDPARPPADAAIP